MPRDKTYLINASEKTLNWLQIIEKKIKESDSDLKDLSFDYKERWAILYKNNEKRAIDLMFFIPQTNKILIYNWILKMPGFDIKSLKKHKSKKNWEQYIENIDEIQKEEDLDRIFEFIKKIYNAVYGNPKKIGYLNYINDVEELEKLINYNREKMKIYLLNTGSQELQELTILKLEKMMEIFEKLLNDRDPSIIQFLEEYINKIDDIEKYFMENLGSNYEKIDNLVQKYKIRNITGRKLFMEIIKKIDKNEVKNLSIINDVINGVLSSQKNDK